MNKTISTFLTSLLFVPLLGIGQEISNISSPSIPNVVNNNNKLLIENFLDEKNVMNIYQNNVKKTDIEPILQEKFLQKIKEAQLENKLLKNQFLVIADRNPKNQVATIAYWNYDTKTIEIGNFSKISTGSVRKGHFYTPTGWFQNLPENGSYRAEGTKNENGIRGYGKKGMRVWDFGWTPSESGYKKGLNIDIRFQLHSTDPDYLESRLGKPDSKGCVRVHSSFNQFLDMYGIIDEEYEKVNYWVLKKDRIKIKDPGSYLLVVDTTI